MERDSRIYIAGHRGLVGSAIVRKLQAEGYSNIVTRTRDELDLLDQRGVDDFFREVKPEYVFVAAARVGGIYANSTKQADFLYENLMIAANVIHAAAENATEKLLFLGSSCVYPKNAPLPISETSLMTGPAEPTNEGYAVAKIAGMKLCEMFMRQYQKRFISAMPTNLYGPRDNFHPTDSHVIPGMMRRFHEAKRGGANHVSVWGTGTAKREFLHVDDLADALYLLMMQYEEPTTVNVGTGEDCTIAELAQFMKETTGFRGEIRYDTSKPDGMPRKVLDVHRIRALGWAPRHTLREGLADVYRWAQDNGVFETEPLTTAHSG